MKYTEELTWILDKNGARLNTDEDYAQNIAFVHSLGRKCDCVGWSTLKPDDPDAEHILQQIAAFCKADGWTARGLYIRKFVDPDADWYKIQSTFFHDADITGEIPALHGRVISALKINAYRELTASPKGWGLSLFLPARFRDVYLASGLTGLDFLWVKDSGKYAAEQYFEAFGTQRIPRMAIAKDIDKQDLRKLGPDGGWLPRLGEVFHRWTQIVLPHCYLKEDMPAGGIVYAYRESPVYIPSADKMYLSKDYDVLVHKDVAAFLLQQKALRPGDLIPVPVLDKVPAGYTLCETSDYPRPTDALMQQSILDCEALQRKNRPLWAVPEKEALKTLRNAKKERKEDFGKKLSKAKIAALAETSYAPMLPYYAVSDGGQLSDEYRLLSVEESRLETEEFYLALKKEELLEKTPEGIVICACADGDRVLLLHDGSVIRFSHEVPEVWGQWPTLPQFMVDALNE